jgi:hypothetical protein
MLSSKRADGEATFSRTMQNQSEDPPPSSATHATRPGAEANSDHTWRATACDQFGDTRSNAKQLAERRADTENCDGRKIHQQDDMQRIAKSDVERIAKELEQISAPVDREVTKFEAIKMLVPVIARMRKRGHSLESVVSFLGEQRIPISVATLKTYLHRLKQERTRKTQRSLDHERQQGVKGRQPAATTSTVITPARTVSTPMSRPANPYDAQIVPREDTSDI